jgi:hypothetical protein
MNALQLVGNALGGFIATVSKYQVAERLEVPGLSLRLAISVLQP